MGCLLGKLENKVVEVRRVFFFLLIVLGRNCVEFGYLGSIDK